MGIFFFRFFFSLFSASKLPVNRSPAFPRLLSLLFLLLLLVASPCMHGVLGGARRRYRNAFSVRSVAWNRRSCAPNLGSAREEMRVSGALGRPSFHLRRLLLAILDGAACWQSCVSAAIVLLWLLSWVSVCCSKLSGCSGGFPRLCSAVLVESLCA